MTNAHHALLLVAADVLLVELAHLLLGRGRIAQQPVLAHGAVEREPALHHERAGDHLVVVQLPLDGAGDHQRLLDHAAQGDTLALGTGELALRAVRLFVDEQLQVGLRDLDVADLGDDRRRVLCQVAEQGLPAEAGAGGLLLLLTAGSSREQEHGRQGGRDHTQDADHDDDSLQDCVIDDFDGRPQPTAGRGARPSPTV
jgi:hypothetical protein